MTDHRHNRPGRAFPAESNFRSDIAELRKNRFLRDAFVFVGWNTVAILMAAAWVLLLRPLTAHEQRLVLTGIGVWAVAKLGLSAWRWLIRPRPTAIVVEQDLRPGTLSRPVPGRRDQSPRATRPRPARIPPRSTRLAHQSSRSSRPQGSGRE